MDLNAEIKMVKFKALVGGEFFVRVSQLPLFVVVLYKKTASGYSPLVSEPIDPEENVIVVLVLPSVVF